MKYNLTNVINTIHPKWMPYIETTKDELGNILEQIEEQRVNKDNENKLLIFPLASYI